MATQPLKRGDAIRVMHDKVSYLRNTPIRRGSTAIVYEAPVSNDTGDTCEHCGAVHRSYVLADVLGDYGQTGMEHNATYMIDVQPCEIARVRWEQVSGDINASTYGGVYARDEGQDMGITLVALCPMVEYVGDDADPRDILVTRAWYSYEDLETLYTPSVHNTFGTGVALEATPRLWRAIHLMEYGKGSDAENVPDGWAACVRRYLGLAVAPSWRKRSK